MVVLIFLMMSYEEVLCLGVVGFIVFMLFWYWFEVVGLLVVEMRIIFDLGYIFIWGGFVVMG